MKTRIVVLGTGFGAFRFLKEAGRIPAEITVVSPRNHFVFTPLLAGTTVGTLEFRSVIESIRTACPGTAFHLAVAESLDPETKTLRCRGAFEPPGAEPFDSHYDTLIIAVGAVPHDFGIPGVREHSLFLKDVRDARAIRQKILECFERAALPKAGEEERKRLLHFVVVGGGPTGVEFAAEMHDLLHAELRRAYPELFPEVRITLLEAGKQILSAYDGTLSAYTLRHFRRQEIEVRMETAVVRVEERRLFLKDGGEIPYGCLVWATGNAPAPFVKSLPFDKDPHGRILVDDHLSVPGREGIFALGDCAASIKNPVPATAQAAEQQGLYLGRALAKRLRNRPMPPFRYRHQGMLAYIGGHSGVADLSKVKGRGFLAFLFWRSVYLTKLVSLRNKILVVLDWARTRIFGRELSRL